MHHTIEGTLKSFNAARRFGFFVPEPGAAIRGDVLVHETAFGPHLGGATPGARLSCAVESSGDGARVIQVLDCRPPEAFSLTRVKWFNIRQAYGFLEDDVGEDIFLHVSIAINAGLTNLPPELPLRALIRRGDRGRYAIVVRPASLARRSQSRP